MHGEQPVPVQRPRGSPMRPSVSCKASFSAFGVNGQADPSIVELFQVAFDLAETLAHLRERAWIYRVVLQVLGAHLGTRASCARFASVTSAKASIYAVNRSKIGSEECNCVGPGVPCVLFHRGHRTGVSLHAAAPVVDLSEGTRTSAAASSRICHSLPAPEAITVLAFSDG
jgi:hypothetical protein